MEYLRNVIFQQLTVFAVGVLKGWILNLRYIVHVHIPIEHRVRRPGEGPRIHRQILSPFLPPSLPRIGVYLPRQ